MCAMSTDHKYPSQPGLVIIVFQYYHLLFFPPVRSLKILSRTILLSMNMPVQQYFYHMVFAHNHIFLLKTIALLIDIGERNTNQMN